MYQAVDGRCVWNTQRIIIIKGKVVVSRRNTCLTVPFFTSNSTSIIQRLNPGLNNIFSWYRQQIMIQKYVRCFRAKRRPADEQEEDNLLTFPQRSEDCTPQGEAFWKLPETCPLECEGIPRWKGKYRCALLTNRFCTRHEMEEFRWQIYKSVYSLCQLFYCLSYFTYGLLCLLNTLCTCIEHS
jgi:hypothetical protein